MSRGWTETQCTRRIPRTLSNEGMKQRYTRIVPCCIPPATLPVPYWKIRRYMMYTLDERFLISRMLNKFDEKCTREGGVSLPHLPSPWFNLLPISRRQRKKRQGPRIPGSVHPTATRVNARRRNKGQKLPERVQAAAGGGWYSLCGVHVGEKRGVG
jgi:hypothetical protein